MLWVEYNQVVNFQVNTHHKSDRCCYDVVSATYWQLAVIWFSDNDVQDASLEAVNVSRGIGILSSSHGLKTTLFLSPEYLLTHTNCNLLRSELFCDVTQRRVVILYRRFGTKYRSHLQGSRGPTRIFFLDLWALKMGPIRCPETSVKDYHSTLRNTPEERRSRQHRGGSLK
jgi:hypothetical protein